MIRLFAILFNAGILGVLQGLIVPLLALLLERRGASALFNGVSSTALYLGVILASPFIERVVRRFGAKRTLQASAWISMLLTVLFPLLPNAYVWLLIRLLLGISLSGMYVATEIWLNRILTKGNRGRVLAFYGLAITIGMSIGPQLINLLTFAQATPFLVSAALYVLPLAIIHFVSDADAQLTPLAADEETGLRRWWRLFLFAPFAMCASLVYGYLDGALNGQFPVYGSRAGLGVGTISTTLTCFMIGSMLFQFPLGMFSDRYGRRPALVAASGIGCVGFSLLPFVTTSTWLVMAVLFCAGGVLGSFYSLGLAYLGDLLGAGDLPTGNVLYTMLYGIGSLLGPSVTGSLMTWWGQDAFAWSVAGMLLCYVVFGLVRRERLQQVSGVEKGRSF